MEINSHIGFMKKVERASISDLLIYSRLIKALIGRRIKEEEKKRIKTFNIGDIAVFYSRKRNTEVEITITRKTKTRLYGQDRSMSTWSVSPVICKRRNGEQNEN